MSMVSPKSSSEYPLLRQSGQSTERVKKQHSRYPSKWLIVGIASILLILIFLNPFGVRQDNKVSLDDWLQQQVVISREQLQQNIGGGARALDVPRGVVIASPSTEDPNYFYQWTRDSALVYLVIVGDYISGEKKLGDLIYNWAKAQDAIQHAKNPVRLNDE